jgi:hypothetical protein
MACSVLAMFSSLTGWQSAVRVLGVVHWIAILLLPLPLDHILDVDLGPFARALHVPDTDVSACLKQLNAPSMTECGSKCNTHDAARGKWEGQAARSTWRGGSADRVVYRISLDTSRRKRPR